MSGKVPPIKTVGTISNPAPRTALNIVKPNP
jgi:hypothetical protein